MALKGRIRARTVVEITAMHRYLRITVIDCRRRTSRLRMIMKD